MPTTNPVPSNDPTDLLFNAQKLDQVVNGSAQYYTDRLGVNRRTMKGISAAADVVLGGLGYAPPVAYASGISLTLTTQTVEYAGEVYAPKLANIPFTTSTWATDSAKFRLIQGVAATDLAASGGSSMIGYMPAGTGAVATTVQAKLREMVSATSYTSLQAAVDYVSGAGGGVVLVPFGTHTLTTNLVLASNVELVGQGFGSNVILEGSSSISGTTLSNAAVRNLRITIGSTHTGLHAIKLSNCSGSQVSGIRFVGLSADKSKYISIYGGENNLIDSVVASDASIFLTANNWDSVPTPASVSDWGKGNRITRCTVTNPGQGIDCLWQQDLIVAFNRVTGATGTYGCGILLEAGNNSAKVIGNVCTGNTRAGFYVEGAASPNSVQGAQFIGNVGSSNGEAGITLSTKFKDIRIIGGTYNSNTGTFSSTDAKGSGIYMQTAGDNVSIHEATMIGNAYAGIVSFAQAFLVTRDNIVESSQYAHVILGGHSNCNFGRLFSAAISLAKYNSVSYASSNRFDDAGVLSASAASTVNPITLGSGGAATTQWSARTDGFVYVRLRIDLGTGFSIPAGGIQFTLAETGFAVPNRIMSTVTVIANGNYKLSTTRVLPATSVVLVFDSSPTWAAGDSIDVQLRWNVFDQ